MNVDRTDIRYIAAVDPDALRRAQRLSTAVAMLARGVARPQVVAEIASRYECSAVIARRTVVMALDMVHG